METKSELIRIGKVAAAIGDMGRLGAFVGYYMARGLSLQDAAEKYCLLHADRFRGLGDVADTVASLAAKSPAGRLCDIPAEDWDATAAGECAAHNPGIFYRHMGELGKAELFAGLARLRDGLTKDGVFGQFSDFELELLCTMNPAILPDIPGDRITRKMVDGYLEYIVRENVHVIDGYTATKTGNSSFIPAEYKDAKYWRCICMVNGYNFRIVPEKYRKTVIRDALGYAIRNQKSYVGALHIAESVPEVTREQATELCKRHFGCMEHIPEKYKTEGFFETLIRDGCYTADPKMAESQVLECIRNHGHFPADRFTEARKWTAGIALAVAGEYPRAVIPKKFLTEDVYRAMVAADGTLVANVPEKCLTEGLCITAYSGHPFGVMELIPEKFRTDTFYREVVRRGDYIPADIPEGYLTEDGIIALIRSGKPLGFADIPQNFRTGNVLRHLSLYNPRGFVHGTEECVRSAVDAADTPGTKLAILEKAEVRPDDLVWDAVLSCPSAARRLDVRDWRMWLASIRKFPQNALDAPDWFWDEYARTDTKAPATGGQPTLFDFGLR